MENIGLTGSTLNRLYWVQVQVQFNSIHNSIQPRPRQGQSEQVKTKINSVQFTVHNVYLAKMFIRSAQSAIQICSVDNSIQRGTGEELVRRGQISDQLYSLFTSVWTWPKVIPTRSKFNLIEIKIHFSVVLGKGQTERVRAQFTGDLSKCFFD